MPSGSNEEPRREMSEAEIRGVFRTLQLPENPAPQPAVQQTTPVIVYSITGNSPPSRV